MGSYRFSFVKILFGLLLLVGLPVFIWAVLTQRIELRKQASVTGPTIDLVAAAQYPNGISGTPGQEFLVAVLLNPRTASVSGAVINLAYDPAVINVEEFTPGTLLPVVLSAPVIATSAGTVSVTLGAEPSAPMTVAGNIGTLRLKLLTTARSGISVANSTIVTAVGNPTNALVGATGIEINGGGTPTPTPSTTNTPTPSSTSSGNFRINWTTQHAYLQAESILISANGRLFNGIPDPQTALTVHSDPPDSGDPNYTTLEVEWTEQGIPMRLNIYFRKEFPTCSSTDQNDCSASPPYWYVSELRTYDGNTPGNWITYNTPSLTSLQSRLGYPWTTGSSCSGRNCPRLEIDPSRVILNADPSNPSGPHIVLRSPWLRAFLNDGPTLIPTPTTYVGPGCQRGGCSGQLCQTAGTEGRATTCEYQQRYSCYNGARCEQQPNGQCGWTQTNQLVSCLASFSSTITPTPPSGCYYTQVCTQSYPPNCRTNLVCPTTYPSPSVSPVPPTYTCTRNAPTVRISPTIQSGNPGQTLTYLATITNNDTFGCGDSQFVFTTRVASGFTSRQQATSMTIPPTATTNVSFTVTAPLVYNEFIVKAIPVSFYATNTASHLESYSEVTYSFVKPTPVTFTFRFRFVGVNGPEASNEKVTMNFKYEDGTEVKVPNPIGLFYEGAGVYQALYTLSNPPPAGTKFTAQIKGPKHAAVRFCQQSGQTDVCTAGQFLTMSANTTFDFTGRPLPAGDLDHNTYVNAADVKLVTDLLFVPTSQHTAENVKTADVNYDGYITNLDLNLIVQSLVQRQDE